MSIIRLNEIIYNKMYLKLTLLTALIVKYYLYKQTFSFFLTLIRKNIVLFIIMSQNFSYPNQNTHYQPYIEQQHLQYNYQPPTIQYQQFQPYNQYQPYQQYQPFNQYQPYQPYNQYQQTNETQSFSSTQTTLQNPTIINETTSNSNIPINHLTSENQSFDNNEVELSDNEISDNDDDEAEVDDNEEYIANDGNDLINDVLNSNSETEITNEQIAIRFKKEIFECVKEMMLANTESDFNLKLEKFKRLETSNENLKYFEDNWLNCIEKWAKYKRSGLVLLLQETNNPVEVVHKQFKSMLTYGSLL